METRPRGLAAGPVTPEEDPATVQRIADWQAEKRARAAGHRWGVWIEVQVVAPDGWVTRESIDAAAPDVDTTRDPRGAWWDGKKSVAIRKAAALRQRLGGPAKHVQVRELPQS